MSAAPRLTRWLWAAFGVVLLTGCFGATGAAGDEYSVPVRLLGIDGLEWPRDGAGQLRYALAIVPGALFGVADRTTLRQLTPEKAYVKLDMDELGEWAAKAARPWHAASGERVSVSPNDTKVARVMLAAFAPEGGSSYGVGFHDLGLRRNLVLLYVDRACTVTTPADDAAAAPDALHYALDLPRAGLYWVRTAHGEPIVGIDPESLSVEVRPRAAPAAGHAADAPAHEREAR